MAENTEDGKKIQYPEEVFFEDARYRRLMMQYRCAILEVETKFRVLNTEFSLQHNRNPIQYPEEVFFEDARYRRLMMQYRCAILEVETKFRVLNTEFSLQHNRNPIETIKTRLKSPGSIVEKMQRKGWELSPESIEGHIFDVAGIRVICSFPEDIYTLAEELMQQDDIVVIDIKDYIAHPKANGIFIRWQRS